ncbi:thiol reductant ABC exporter subunit CydD [Kribbia dieselivorans]|uniref:thiol reductant ABC exporter subunit CydD n=1 Tax=Kribbia dieselivorans TaxID=331526 RepID=UPI000A801C84|nr:thiol reductant ABC exporter subunit CydD [Kribbia dieselivorans]
MHRSEWVGRHPRPTRSIITTPTIPDQKARVNPFDPRLLRTVPGARRPVLLLGVLGVLQGVATVATAFALTAVVVAAVRQTDLREPSAWLLGLFLVRAVIAWSSERIQAWAGTRVATALREQLLATWLQRDADSRPDRARALTLATQGAASVEPYIAKYLPALLAAAVVPPLAIITLFVVDWPSAIVVILTVPLLPLFAALIGVTTRDDTRTRWQTLSDLAGHFLDVVRGLPTLVSYGRGERQVATIREVSDKHRLATMRTLRLAFLSSAALELLASLSVAIVAVLTGLRLTHGTMELGAGLVAILLAPEAYWPIRRVGAEFHSAADGAEALEDILTELEAATDAATDAAGDRDDRDSPADLIARDVTYAYPGTATPVLRNVSLTATRGLTALTGPSGIGKSTLLEILAGIRRPTSGATERGGETHLVSQRPFLGAGSVRANLTLGTTATDAAVAAAVAQVGLTDVIDALGGLDAPLGDDGFGVSAGQRARLVLARALLSDAPIVLLDEPTAHLDPESAALVHRIITDLARERTVVAVTHRTDLMDLADQRVDLGAEVVAR